MSLFNESVKFADADYTKRMERHKPKKRQSRLKILGYRIKNYISSKF